MYTYLKTQQANIISDTLRISEDVFKNVIKERTSQPKAVIGVVSTMKLALNNLTRAAARNILKPAKVEGCLNADLKIIYINGAQAEISLPGKL